MARFQDGSRIGRRRLIGLLGGSAGLLTLTACLRRDVSQPPSSGATAPTQAPAVQTKPAAEAKPAGAAPATAAKPAAGAATTGAATTAKPAEATRPAEAAKPAAGPPKRGGTITAAMQNDWLTFDTAFNTASTSTQYVVYDSLVFYERNDQGVWDYTPGLAEKWELGDKDAVFHLRKGVKFHDGSDFNADVMAWNIGRWINEPKSVAKGSMGGIDWKNPTTVVDPYTLKINLTGPTPTILEQFSDPNTFPMSKVAFEKMGADAAGANPVGTGPFQFVEWKKNDRVIVKRNDNYWMKDASGQALPYLDGITYRLIIDDSVRMLEMKAGSVDFTELIQGKDVTEAKADPNLNYLEADWVGNAYRLIFNAAGGKFHDNVNLRKAALYAINHEALAQALGAGIGRAEKYFPRPGSLGYDESLPYYWYDPEKAKALMKEAGHPDGIDVEFLVIARAVDKLQAEMLKSMFDAVGIRTRVEALERVAMNQRLLTGGAEYDFTTTRGASSAGDPDDEYRAHFWSNGNFAKARLKDPEIDEAIISAASTYDRNERIERYKKLQRLLFDKAVYGFLWTQNWNWVMNKRLQALPPPMESLWNFRKVWVTG
ncbi:MAG: ABC transporter substrate-binding protein [Chloroflexi bacterium]|nr:ABC transporter substrate-binding protein [Chloroflexota bacterium]